MHIILGPPGTGKTTKLLTLVEEFMDRGVPPDRIGYFSFTRQAAIEAILTKMRTNGQLVALEESWFASTP